MSYPATVYKIMIASPSDVPNPRRQPIDAVHEWNAVHSQNRGIVLLPVSWETHASPEMGERPQGVLNRQLLADADFLVAIFWTRLGTPTGEHESGTVEEIREHLEAGKPAMVYFSSEPVVPESIDQDQYQRLRDFKSWCETQGLVQTFASLGEFRSLSSRQLMQSVLRHTDAEEQSTHESMGVSTAQPFPALSEAARDLLSEAAKDQRGTLTHVGTLSGCEIGTNGRSFVTRGDARSEAQWRGAVAELEAHGLIKARSYKREVFQVTDLGYRVADAVR